MVNNVYINKGAGGLGRPLAGEDHISGYIHYTSILPSGFASGDRIKQVFSISDAEALGITNTHIGETRATGSTTITAIGSTGATINISVLDFSSVVDLGTYTVVLTDTTTSLVATNVATTINAGTSTHGYSATASTSTINISAPSGTGAGASAFTFDNSSTGSLTYSSVTFNGGIASTIDIIHYNIDQYFIAQPKGNLYVGIYTASTDFNEVVLMQDFSIGKIRQIGVYTQAAFSTDDVTRLQTQATLCDTNNKPLEVLYQANFVSVSDLTTLTDLHTLNAENVSVCFAQDGANVGYDLFLATKKTIGSVGITLGAVSFAKVNESIAWVGKFNMSNVEWETLCFANGTFYTAVSDGSRDNIDAKGYIFLKKYVGLPGSYFNNPYTCVAVTSDYCRINNNRTINKASRNLRTYYLPQVASPVKVNADGTLTEDVISFFETLGENALEAMQRDSELSAFSVTINPVQDVESTNELIVDVKLVPVGTSDVIIIDEGFTVSIAS
jgi:hypothetical protein